MEILVDGKIYTGELAGGTLQEVLNDLTLRGLEEDRSMREVKVNGQPFEAATMGPAVDLPRDRIQRLEVETIAAREVALHFIANAPSYLNAILDSIEAVSELFRVSDEKEANERYLDTLDSLQLFMQVLQIARQTLGLDFDRISAQGVSAEQRLQRLSELVGEILAVQEQEDWVLLADVLQYDLTAELRSWQALMPAIKENALT